MFPEFLTPNQFAWRPWFIKYVFEANDIDNVFWIDSGICTFGSIGFIFEHNERHVYWLTEEGGGWINYNFTHDKWKKCLSANDEELKGNQLLAGLSGFNKEKGIEMVYKYILYGHRHDQSI